MNNFSGTVTICGSQEKPVTDALLFDTCSFISGSKNNFCSSGNFFPYISSSYIIIIIIFVYTITDYWLQIYPVLHVSQEGLSSTKHLIFF